MRRADGIAVVILITILCAAWVAVLAASLLLGEPSTDNGGFIYFLNTGW